MWLFFPTSRSAQEEAASTEECTPLSTEQATRLARSCTASGKHSPPRTWSQRWMRGGWIRRLSGVTAPQCPEVSAITYCAWLDGILSASSAGSPASHSAAPESSAGPRMSDGSGLPSSTSSAIAAWDGARWKTSLASPELERLKSQLWPRSPEAEVCSVTVFELDEYGSAKSRLSEGDLLSGELLGIWPRSGGVSNGRLYERPTLERPTGESGCSSSGMLNGSTWDRNEYPTPSASPYGRNAGGAKPGPPRPPLETWAGGWSTPRANWPTPRAAHGAGQSDDLRGGRSLDVIATSAHWPTATVGDSRASGGRNECENANNGTTLSDLVRGRGRLNWRFVAWLMGWRWLIGDTPRPWPPGPDDAEAWAEVLEERPDLAPATAEPEPERAAMLRLLGNGVVPEQAAEAVTQLLQRSHP